VAAIAVAAFSMLVAAAGAAFVPGEAAGVAYAPLDRPGPPLSVPKNELAAALTCSPGVEDASRAPVLLVHGTGATPEENWSWTYQPALAALGVPTCTVRLPERGQGDIQLNGEYVVHAIRSIHRRSGRRIAIIGHSQGGMLPRWPLRFWPDTRKMVDDQIGFAPSNHGTTRARGVCRQECTPANWQQMDGSNFLQALNSRKETFAGISYTAIYSRYDEVVVPPEGAELHGGGGEITNVAIQDICPLDLSEHFLIGLVDRVAFALAIDALEHDGPADVTRVGARGCDQPPIPGLQPAGIAPATVGFAVGEGGAEAVPAEPELRCYVTANCPRLRIGVSPSHAVAGRRMPLRFWVRARVDGRTVAVPDARLRLGRYRELTGSDGRARMRVRFSHPATRKVNARAAGYASGRATIEVR
jgi:hypothetical protein